MKVVVYVELFYQIQLSWFSSLYNNLSLRQRQSAQQTLSKLDLPMKYSSKGLYNLYQNIFLRPCDARPLMQDWSIICTLHMNFVFLI